MGISSNMFLLPLFIMFMMILTCNSDNSTDELELVSVLNDNRQQRLLNNLTISSDLNCVATRITESAEGQGVSCDYFNFTIINNDLNSFSSDCTGQNDHVVGFALLCQTELYTPTKIINQMVDNQYNDSLSYILYDGNYTQVGASISGTDSGEPYFSCLTFDSGNSTETPTSNTDMNEPPPPMNEPPPPIDNAPVSIGYKLRSCFIRILLSMIIVLLV